MLPGVSSTAPLVERDAELDTLRRLLDDAVEGRGGAARVLGASGLGKTALLRALGDRARGAGIRTWPASAGQLDRRVPFGVVRRLLDRPVRALSEERRADLERGPSRLALAHLWGVAATEVRGGPPAQGDVLHSLSWLLEELVGTEPLLLVADDAQWADEESLVFLGSLRERLAELPVVAVVAAREDALDQAPALSALVADRDAAVLRLAPLSTSGIEAVLGERWSELSDATSTAVLEATGGNPFLVHALADALAYDGEELDPEQVRAAVPSTVVDLVVARLAALPTAEQALARAVAVLESAPLAIAAELADLDREAAAVAADNLRRASLLADTGALTFRHALLRSAVYATLGPGSRDRLHRTAGRLLADSTAPDRSRAAAHLLASSGAGDPWAVDLLRAAATEAMTLGAPQPAVAMLERAVAEPALPAVLPDLLLELGLAQARTLDPACIDTFRRSATLVADPVVRARHLLPLASAYNYAGLHPLAAQCLEEVRTTIAADRELELTVEATWASAGLLVPDLVATVRRRLEERGDLAGTTVGERLVLIQQLTVAAETCQPAATIRGYAERVIGDWGTPEQLPETGDWVWPRVFLAQIGDYDAVRALTDRGFADAERRGSIAGVVTAAFVRAFTELHAGGLLEAEHYYRLMLEPGRAELGPGPGLLVETLGYGGLAQALALQGRTVEALELLGRLPDQLPPGAPVNGAAMAFYGRAVTRRAVGDLAGAVAAAREVGRLGADLEIDSPIWASWRPLAIDPLIDLDRLDEARELAAEHLELCARTEVPHLVGEALVLSGSVTADPAEGIALARRGVEALAGTSSRLRVGMGLLRLGSRLRRSGSRREARDHLRDAVDVLTGCGALPAAGHARAELAATGVRLSRAEARRLTPSERRVAERALEGLGNRDIAARLHVSRKTVETQLSAVYRKLGIAGRDQLSAELLAREG